MLAVKKKRGVTRQANASFYLNRNVKKRKRQYDKTYHLTNKSIVNANKRSKYNAQKKSRLNIDNNNTDTKKY